MEINCQGYKAIRFVTMHAKRGSVHAHDGNGAFDVSLGGGVTWNTEHLDRFAWKLFFDNAACTPFHLFINSIYVRRELIYLWR